MEGSSFDSNSNQSSPSASAANDFLSNLPSRGLFSSSLISSNPGGMRVYVCDHDTCPPEDQCIKTDQQNILIRSLTLNKYKGDSKGGAESSRKRAGEKIQDTRGKRLNSQANSGQEGSNGQTSTKEKDLQSLTVERLRALLKAKGLPPKGKKDELIARLKNANG